MNDGLGKPLVRGEIVWILDTLLKYCIDEYSQEEYAVKKMSMVGADYLHVTIFMWHMFIFNHLT